MAILMFFLSKTCFSGALIQMRCLNPSFFRHPMQPVREQFGGVLTRYGTGKTQPTFAEDALVRIRAQEAFHQHRNPGRFGFSRTVIPALRKPSTAANPA